MKSNYLLVIACAMLICSCKKESTRPGFQSDMNSQARGYPQAAPQKKIYVTNLDELYEAVNDPANAAARVVLAPGEYVLNSSYPNGGRLELQENMTLQGQPGKQDEVMIDMSALPTASFVIPAGRTAQLGQA